MTPTIQPSQHPKWDAFKTNFLQSNYITDFWNWLLTLLSKSAELVLFGSILYSSYQLIPGVPAVPAGLDAFLFLVQQAALDIGGMGLLKLAKRAGLPRNSFPMQVGVTLVVLMILNVVLATIKHALPMVPGVVFVVAEALLLIIRAIMAVLFGHAIHALREEYGDSMITVKEAQELEAQFDELSAELVQVKQSFHHQLSRELSAVHENFQQQLAHLSQSFQQCIDESTSESESSFHHQLAFELSPLRESVQQYQKVLTLVPALQAQVKEIERSTTEEIRQIHTALEAQTPRPERETQLERPVLRVVPAIQSIPSEVKTSHTGKFDARAFVFARLQENPGLKLSELSRLAQAAGQELSQPTASRYRKQFLARSESSENFQVSSDESSESSTVKIQRLS